VIHRDIKPSNNIRRRSDRKLVLIDFGAVKQVSTQLLEPNGQTRLTVSIGTQGYAPSEQSAGHAFFSSDIYAVGMTAIKALTGLYPHKLPLDAKTGEVLWTDKAQISPELAEIISTMVRHDYTRRYRSASEALSALKNIFDASTQSSVWDSSEDLDAPTAIWVSPATEIPDSATRPSPPSSPLNLASDRES
jgi:serine/threonine protein kinase